MTERAPEGATEAGTAREESAGGDGGEGRSRLGRAAEFALDCLELLVDLT